MSPRSRSVYLDRPSSRRRSSSYSSPGRSGGGFRRFGFVLLALVVVAVALGVTQWMRSLPRQSVRASYAPSVTAPGRPVRLPWPTQGQAAVAVGTFGPPSAYGGSAPVPIASLAKIMTAYQVLSDHPLDAGQTGPQLSVTAADVADYRARARHAESVVAVRAGERLSEYQALQALLIPSANNVAVLLAKWDAGSVPAFLTRMNATAARLGMSHTHYTDPAGQLASTTSTAIDQVTLAQAAMRLPVFASIVAQPAATFPVAGRLFNFNYNIGHDGFIGVKTGSNAAAGGCWAFAASRVVAGRTTTVIGVVLGQHGSNGELIQPALDVGKRLADAAPATVSRLTLVAARTAVGSLSAPWRHQVELVTADPVAVLAAPGQRFGVQLRLTSPASRELRAGTTVGTLTVAGVTTRVVTATAAPAPTVGWRLSRL